MSSHPPRLADWLLRRVLPLGKRGESILGDLREEFRANSSRFWYWQQALRLTIRYVAAPDRSPRLDDRRSSPMLHDLVSDLRTAGRMFVRNPGTSLVIVATLSIAIGAATVGFSFADLALFRGIPVDDPKRVVSVFASDTHGSNPRARVSIPDFLDIRERATLLERVSVMRQTYAPLIKDGQSRTLTVSQATGDTIAAMGQSAVVGRALSSVDDPASAPKVVTLSYRYWREEFSSRQDAIGKTLQIGREIYTIVGVMSPELEFGNLAEIDVWMPMATRADAPRDARNLRFMARLKPGVRFEAAAAQLSAIGDALAIEHPDTNAGWKMRLIPIRDLTGGDGFWVVIALFLLSVGLVMAIATANVSNLVLVRAIARQRELAVRAALGARRSRIVRQLIVEGGALSVLSAVVSVPLAYGGLLAIQLISAEPVFKQLAIDAHELSFVAALALVCPLLFSIAPARTISRTDTRQILAASGARGSTAATRGRGFLVVAQVALAVILLMVSTLALRSVNAIYSKPTGLDASQSLSFSLDFNDAQFPDDARAAAAARATAEALARTPGVAHIAMMSALPILGAESMGAFSVDGEVVPAGESVPNAVITTVSSEGATAMGLRMLSGAWWERQATGVAVISRETATRYFGGVDRAVGRQLTYQAGTDEQTARVVGVSSDVLFMDFTRPAVRIWVSMDQTPRRVTYLLKATTDAAGLAPDVRAAVASTAATIPIESMETLEQGLKRARSSDDVIIAMLLGFAAVALVLASAGLFGVVSYTASQRTAEFGTRMALGASAWDVVRLVSSHSLKLLTIGLAIGLAGGIAIGLGMGSLLNGLSPADPVTIAMVSGVLAVVTLAATAIPALRAARIDPAIALRAE